MSLALASVGVTADLLAHQIDRLHGPVTLVRRASDLVEVLAVVRSGLARAVVVAEGAEQFGPEAMESLAQAGALVAVVEGHDDDRLVELGAVFIPVDAEPREAAEILLEEGQRAQSQSARRTPQTDPLESTLDRWAQQEAQGESLGAEPTGEAGRAPELDAIVSGELPGEQAVVSGVASDTDSSEASGVVVVWGPHGSPGRTTVAVNVAAEMAAMGHAVMLVDLDTWGPSVAHMLGLLDETAGVALACRAADRNRLDMAALDRAAVRVDLGGAHLDVLTGLTRSERWPELRGGSVAKLLQGSRQMRGPADRSDAPIVVVDVGFSLEEDEELSFDTQAPRRNAAALVALEQADLVLAVVAADVVGLPRAAKSLPAVMERSDAPVMVVANKVRKAAAGRSPRAGIREAWEAVGAPAPISDYVSFEPATIDRAMLDGSVLRECAGGSVIRGELKDVAHNVVRRLAGAEVVALQEEDVRETSFGRRMSAWLRR